MAEVGRAVSHTKSEGPHFVALATNRGLSQCVSSYQGNHAIAVFLSSEDTA